jgi:hypothetical protein
VTAKEQVLAEAPGWSEEQARRALIAAGSAHPHAPQPPFSLLGAFRSDRRDLSERASRDEFQPERFR